MSRLFSSLRGQLFVGLLVPLVVVALVNVWFSYHNASRTAYLVLDRALAASASTIAEQIRARGEQLEVEIPPAALGMFESRYADVVYYRVVDDRGRLIRGYGDLPAPPAGAVNKTRRFFDADFREAPLRLVSILQPVPSAQRTLYAHVTVGVTLQSTDAMIRDVWISNALQQAALVLAAFGLAWLSVSRGFSPLLRMGREVAERRPNEFKPFDVRGVQRELLPFVSALNHYMARLSRNLSSHRRFIANAAHQLRTPITLLRTQAEVALRDETLDLKDEAARAIIETTRHMARLINQLLILSKTEADPQQTAAIPVDMVALTREVLEEQAQLAVASDTDLAFETMVSSAHVLGEATMLREVVANLADNALRYAAGGTVDVCVAAKDGQMILTVTDDGPGIPAEDRDLVFERFYRVRERAGQVNGSGLGLSIVREIVQASDGRVRLAPNPRGRGLVASVTIPLDERVVEDGRPPLEEHAL